MRLRRRGTRARARISILVAGLALLTAACGPSGGEMPEELEGFWFFSFDGRGGSPDGLAFAYLTTEGAALGGGVAAAPVGGPLTGTLDGTDFTLTLEDVDGSPVVSVEGRLHGETARGEWAVDGGPARGGFTARRFEPTDYPPAENPFLGTWNNFDDGGVTTLIFGEDYRFTGSEADLEFAGQYGFSPRHDLVGVYEADAQSVHMEKLTYRFEDEDTVVLNGSVYRRQQ
jgi:hypothetical protein